MRRRLGRVRQLQGPTVLLALRGLRLWPRPLYPHRPPPAAGVAVLRHVLGAVPRARPLRAASQPSPRQRQPRALARRHDTRREPTLLERRGDRRDPALSGRCPDVRGHPSRHGHERPGRGAGRGADQPGHCPGNMSGDGRARPDSGHGERSPQDDARRSHRSRTRPDRGHQAGCRRPRSPPCPSPDGAPAVRRRQRAPPRAPRRRRAVHPRDQDPARSSRRTLRGSR